MTTAFCKECGKPMKYVLHFEQKSYGAYFFCKTCNYRTKLKKINLDEYSDDKDSKKIGVDKKDEFRSQKRNR